MTKLKSKFIKDKCTWLIKIVSKKIEKRPVMIFKLSQSKKQCCFEIMATGLIPQLTSNWSTAVACDEMSIGWLLERSWLAVW